ncbi:hypothetical protein GCM10010182_11690 [Actinomadura cremea]|nr:hypothetical protein GCM10010182_11690 [Actinomadura cremea]
MTPGSQNAPDRPAQPDQHTAVGQVGEDLAGLGHVAGEPVELGHGEHAGRPHRPQGPVQAAAVAAGGPGEAPVDVDPIGRDAETEQLLGLDDDVLLVGGAAGVPGPDGTRSRSVHALKCSG